MTKYPSASVVNFTYSTVSHHGTWYTSCQTVFDCWLVMDLKKVFGVMAWMMATMSSRVMSKAAAQVKAVFVILSAEVVQKVALTRSREW